MNSNIAIGVSCLAIGFLCFFWIYVIGPFFKAQYVEMLCRTRWKLFDRIRECSGDLNSRAYIETCALIESAIQKADQIGLVWCISGLITEARVAARQPDASKWELLRQIEQKELPTEYADAIERVLKAIVMRVFFQRIAGWFALVALYIFAVVIPSFQRKHRDLTKELSDSIRGWRLLGSLHFN